MDARRGKLLYELTVHEFPAEAPEFHYKQRNQSWRWRPLDHSLQTVLAPNPRSKNEKEKSQENPKNISPRATRQGACRAGRHAWLH